MQEFLTHHGWWAIAVGAILERDLTGFLAGVVAHVAPINLGITILSGFVGAVVGDLGCYAAGWWFGRTLGHKPFIFRAREKLRGFSDRFGPFAIVICQFLYGLRTTSMVVFGIQHTSLRRFIFFDMIGCALLMTLLACSGYFLSSSAEILLIKAKRYRLWAMIVIALCVLIFLAFKGLRRRIQNGGPK